MDIEQGWFWFSSLSNGWLKDILANLAVHCEDSVTIRKKKKWKLIITRLLNVQEMKKAPAASF